MTRDEAAGAVGVVSTVAVLGLFLPSMSEVWEANPDDPAVVDHLRTGELVYLTLALVLTVLASYANGSPAPFVAGFGLAVVIVLMQEYARNRPGRG